MKKTISFLLVFALLFSMETTTFAGEIETAEETYTVNGLCVDKQISQDEVNALPESILREIQNVGGTLVSVSTSYYDMESSTETRAVMPTSDFKLTVTATRLDGGAIEEEAKEHPEIGGDVFMFVATGEWLVNPVWEFTDCMGICWSDEFTLYDSYGYTLTENYFGTGKPLIQYEPLTLNDFSPEQGVAYDVELLLFDRQDEITIVGKVYKENSSGSANVCASYGHVIITASSIGVSFSSGDPIGMEVGIMSGIQMASPGYDSFNY